MCKPSKPKAPAILPEAPTMPQVTMPDEEMRKRKTKAGASMGTLLTGPGGTTNATQGGLTLLGGSPRA